VTWYVPIYPGITTKDIRDSAVKITKVSETIFEGRKTGDRVRVLRSEGLSFQAIADRLGLHKNTVAAILSGDKGDTE
jgi:DNA-binding NarL/FixJ family response regulator